MSKKILKVLSCICIAIMITTIAISSFALTPSDISGNTSVSGTTEIQNVGQSIVGILQTVGIVLSVVVLIVLGIKYMMGSAEEKAEYKKTFIPYIVGAALIFAASAIARAVVTMTQSIT